MGVMVSRCIACTAFHPPTTASYSKDDVHFVTLRDKRTRIAVWMATPPHSTDKLSSYTSKTPLFIYSHGNAEDIGSVSQYCAILAEDLGCNVLTYDYVNYGQSSPGITNETNLREAADAVYDYAMNKLCAPHVTLMGRSIGSAPSVYLASTRTKHSSLVLISPLASGARTLRVSGMIPAPMLVALDNIFCPSVESMPRVQCPVLIIHGNQDTVVPVQNAYDLYYAIPTHLRRQPLFLGTTASPAGHNDLEEKHSQKIITTIRHFVDDVNCTDNTE